MPYRVNADLPASVRDHLPPHAQDIYRAAFNHAFASHAGKFGKKRSPTALPGRPSSDPTSKTAIAGYRVTSETK
jgi:hypothetical protein